MSGLPYCLDHGLTDDSVNSLTPAALYSPTNQLRGFSPRANYTDRATAAIGEVNVNFCG
jgi:hypothetical protein